MGVHNPIAHALHPPLATRSLTCLAASSQFPVSLHRRWYVL